ncbi:MAG: hypothetical protein ACK4UU_08650, partial [Fimbriimonadales bacterium]
MQLGSGLLFGGLVGYGAGYLAGTYFKDRGLENVPLSVEVAGLVAVIYVLCGAVVALGSLNPAVGAKLLNVEDEDEVREMRTQFIHSGAAMALWGVALLALALAAILSGAAEAQTTLPSLLTPAGVIPPITIPDDTPSDQPSQSPAPERPRPQKRNTLDALQTLRSWESLQQEIQRTVSISGRKSVGFHLHQIEGDAASFRDQNYFGRGGQRITDNTEMTIRVNKFLGFLTMHWRWTNSRFSNPYDAQITYTYESPNLTLEWGDITASLGSANPLVGFQRTLKGATANFQWERNRLRYIRSETKAAARTITIPGNDSAGPYYLQGSQLVDGSERVQVDGVEKRRGEDYTLDYFGGILRFRDGMIIPRTSTIV